MNKNVVSVFLGHPIEEPTEREFLARLRTDLVQVSDCLILANFYAGRAQRQIDFVVVTDHRAVHCELKGFSLPTIGRRNGPWQQRLPDGTLRDLDDNYYDQANKGTYAISDAVRDLQRRDASVPGEAKFYKSLETIVCFFPHLPQGSEFERFAHVDVVGYEELLGRLKQPGRRPPWGRDHLEALIRSLSLTPIDERSPEERNRAKIEQQLEDYRRRFTTSMANGLSPLVGVPATLDGTEADAAELSQLVEDRDTVFLVGESGAGKSHLARHAAIELSDRGGMVVWTPALEYERGKLSALLRRATAPYSTLDGIDLIRHAVESGRVVTVIVDGLNECPPDARAELLDQIGALRMRIRLAVVVSAQEQIAVPEALVAGVTLRLLPPTPGERRELLDLYGAGGMEDLYPAFATPHELSIAAQCVGDLPPLQRAAMSLRRMSADAPRHRTYVWVCV